MKHLTKLLTYLLYTLLLSACANQQPPVHSLGVSTDGRYVISAHRGGKLYLWDIQKKEKKHLSDNAFSYSAYFIPNSHEFMWQDGNNVVHIQNVLGQEITQFPHFKTKGQIISADKSFYLSADEWGKFYKGHGKNLVPIYTDAPVGPSQTYNFSLSGNYFLSVGDTMSAVDAPPAETKLTANPVNFDEHKKDSYRGITLWNKNTLKPIARLWGNEGRTMGLISPDGQWIVAVSENGQRYMWSLLNPYQQFRLSSVDGIFKRETMTQDTSKLLPIPEKYKDKSISRTSSFAVAFVSEKDFILLPNSYDELALLYTVGDPWIQAYVEIGNKPLISKGNLSIATAYKANILVTGQYGRGGINVYKYHPETKELEKIWIAD